LVYQYHASRAGDVAASYLGGYKGYVQTDGYAGYDFLDRRRRFNTSNEQGAKTEGQEIQAEDSVRKLEESSRRNFFDKNYRGKSSQI